MLQDKRQASRHKVLKAAKLVAMNAWVFIDGIVRDQSTTGARISCAQPNLVPDEFRLLVIKENTIQNCRVKWRRDDSLGVAFSGEPKVAPPRKL